MPGPGPKIDPLLTPRETAALFHVDPRTVTRWAREGKLPSARTLGGHRRYRVADVMARLHPRTAAADPRLTAGVDSLWSHQTPAILRLRLKLKARKILTLGQLTDRSAARLGDEGFWPEQVQEIRLALYGKDLALSGDVLARKVA